MRAYLGNWRGSPRRFNEYLRAVRGLYALDAVNKLKFMPSPYAHALKELITSAVANATSNPSILPNNLIIFEATVGRAMFLKRICFRGRGRTGRVTKFGSNVQVVLKDASDCDKKCNKKQDVEKKSEKSVIEKKTLKKESK